ncbi:DUF3795 domain-containing protein [candidate division KSB1 bacterium]
MNIDINHVPVCGYYCGDCHFLDKPCKGCMCTGGKPFWSEEMPGGLCPIYNCCVNEKKLEHCGLCEELVCKIFLGLRDPNISDEVFRKSIKDRETALRRREEVGTRQWIAELAESLK